jgi:hypothetical protein
MRLIFVYNAKAGFLNGMMDSIHKTVSPDTYECSLCAVTHGFFTMDKAWRAYLKSLPYEASFYHRPDFRAQFPADADQALPLIALEEAGALKILVGPADLKSCKDSNALAAMIDAKLSQLASAPSS